MLPLGELQLRFLGALDPASPPIDATLLAAVNGTGSLDAAQRIRIYADMYRARLVDVLREDYPRVAAILGDADFAALACRYLARHPSTHPSVRHVGRRFADWIAGEATVAPHVADLARLEWAHVEVFDAADAEPLRLADLESLPPDEWPALRLPLIPACLVLESAWPVHDIWASADPGREPEANAPADACAGRDSAPERVLQAWTREPTVVRVWREGFSVSHAAMGPDEQRAFRVLARGEPFGEICAAIEDGLDADTAARQIGAILLRWLEDGLIARPQP
jgi:Putative DNA-binding domain